MASKPTIAESNVAAEARAVEEGLRAEVAPGARWVKVRSTSWRHKYYEIQPIVHIDGLISFSCRPHGRGAYREDHLYATSRVPGLAPCMHAAAAVRRLERHGLARYDAHGRWQITDKARSLSAPIPCPDDLLEGLPR